MRFRLSLLLFVLMCNAGARAAEWEYAGGRGPDHWAELSSDYSVCATGAFQSPFNIVPDIEADLADLDIHYGRLPVEVTNDGKTLVTNGGADDYVRIGDTDWKLLQLHFHTPGEHLIDGRSFPMEVQFVHQAADGRIAIIAAMIAEGPANPAIAELWNVAPYDGGVTNGGPAVIALRNLLPDDQSYIRFMGSLTTPPCTEGINWHMMTQPITASPEQIAAFRSVFSNNARPIQNRNGRLVVTER